MSRLAHAALLILLLTPALASGQGVRAWSLALDNDGFVFWDPPSQRSDWYYTHGMQLEAVLGRTPPGLDRAVCGEGAPEVGGCYLTRVSVGQQIYTPANVFSSVPPPEDHPYGGLLYAEMAADRVDPDGLTRLALRVGVTGGPSLGQPAHQGFHRWLGKAEPTGWEYQLPFEVAFALALHRTLAWSPMTAEAPVSVALLPEWGATLGTLRTSADFGLALRLGVNAPPVEDWQGSPRKGFHASADVGFQGEVVLRDLFLDGATFAESVSTERDIWVDRRRARLRVGVGGFSLEFSAIRVSPRFRAQPEPHTYGTIRLLVRP